MACCSREHYGLDLNVDDLLSWQFAPVPVSVAVRYSGFELKKAGRLGGRLQLGPLSLQQPVVRISEGTRLLGAELLQPMRLSFDQRNKRIRMQAYAENVISSGPLRDWGLGFRPRTAGLEVTGVFKATPAAAAGIKQGDLLVSIDGVTVHERPCRQLSDPEPDRAILGFLRGDEEFLIELDTAVLVP